MASNFRYTLEVRKILSLSVLKLNCSHHITKLIILTKHTNPIWNFFAVEDDTTGVGCISCKTIVSAKAPRLRAHRGNCLANSSSQKRPLPEDDSLVEPSTKPTEPTAKKMRMVQSSMNSHCQSTDQSMSDQLDEPIAKLFFACNLPFNKADHPVFEETIQML